MGVPTPANFSRYLPTPANFSGSTTGLRHQGDLGQAGRAAASIRALLHHVAVTLGRQMPTKARSIAHHLKVAGKKVEEEDLILHILHGLPPQYEAMLVSISIRKDPVSMTELLSLLLSHEAYLGEGCSKKGPLNGFYWWKMALHLTEASMRKSIIRFTTSPRVSESPWPPVDKV
ncbi:hypothetical protein EJ110_NYTH51526 [Nymphaea thermarum]|nr:hypothetical protein EJ110_NYTH51526 [Nymphaea thermarum]